MKQDLNERAKKIVDTLLSSMNDQEKQDLLPKIAEKIRSELDIMDSTGEVVSAVKLEKKQVADIEKALKKLSGRTVHLRNTVDRDIIGGIVIRYKDMVIDQSLRRQLDDIQAQVYES